MDLATILQRAAPCELHWPFGRQLRLESFTTASDCIPLRTSCSSMLLRNQAALAPIGYTPIARVGDVRSHRCRRAAEAKLSVSLGDD